MPLNKETETRKLIRQRPNDWQKFQEQLKKLHLTEICQTDTNK